MIKFAVSDTPIHPLTLYIFRKFTSYKNHQRNESDDNSKNVKNDIETTDDVESSTVSGDLMLKFSSYIMCKSTF